MTRYPILIVLFVTLAAGACAGEGGGLGEPVEVDAESGAQEEVTFGRYRLAAYRQTVSNFCQKLRETCAAHGSNYFLASSATSLETLLLKQLRQAEVWG